MGPDDSCSNCNDRPQLPGGDFLHANIPALTPEESLIEAVWLVQGVQLTTEDYAENQSLYAESDQRYQRVAYEAARSPDQWMLNYEITNGKVLSIGVSVGLGLFSGGSFNILGGAIALAGSLFGSGKRKNNGKDSQKKEEEKFNQTYGIDSGGQLAIEGTPIPMAFGNRNLSVDAEGNKHGGVRVGGMLLLSSIITSRGTNYLRQLWALSSGADADTGHGQIRHVAVNEILFDKQNRNKFNKTEIQTLTRSGTPGQSPIPWFTEYSQNLSPSNYNVFGIDRRGVVESSTNSTDFAVENGVNVAFSQGDGDITKTRSTDEWDAYAWDEKPVGSNGHLRFEAGQTGTTRAAGFSGFQGAIAWQDLDHGFYFTPAGYAIVEGGKIVLPAPGIAFNAGTLFSIDISAIGDRLIYRVGGTDVFVSSIRPSATLYANILFKSSNSRFDAVRTSASLSGIKGENIRRTTFTAIREEFERMDSSDSYALCNGQISRDATSFRLIQKTNISRQMVTDSLVSLQVGTPIFAYWVGKYETTKHISSIYFNLAFNVNARTADNSAYTTFGVLFDVWVRRAGASQSAESRLGRFYVRSRTPTTQYRSIQFKNFPLGRYYFEFQPRCSNTGDERIYELTDSGVTVEDETLITLDGKRILVRGELNNISEAGSVNSQITAEMSYSNRGTISSEQGPTGRIASVNERVEPIAIANPTNGLFNAYEKLATLAIQYEASDRIQSSPGISTPIWECKSIPNLMEAGTSSGLSTPNVLNDPTTQLAIAQPGWILRNLSKGIESRVLSATAQTIQTDGPLGWEMGDRYLVYFLGASPYFPDIAAYVQTSTDGGAGDKIDRDADIDYPSYVYSRAFCVEKKFFWNGLVQSPESPIVQWTEKEARGSLLIPGKINGRWALFPDEVVPDEEPQVFNTSNARNASMEWADWTDSNVNRLVVRYTDGRDLFEEDGARFRTKLVTIQTLAAFNGTENPVEQTLELPAVTSPLQAAEVGITAFNSAIQQTRAIAFDTSMQAAYLQGGKLIRFQHSLLDVGENLSSHVAEAEGIFFGTQRVRLAEPPIIYEGLTSAASSGSAVFDSNFIESPVAIGDLLINVSQNTSGIITGKTITSLTAPVSCDRGDLIQVLNLTMPADMRASVTYRETGSSQDGIEVAFERRDRAVWLVLSGLTQSLAPLDPVNLGNSSDSLYRVQKITPSGKSIFRVSGVYHPGTDLYSRAGLVVSYDDEDYFG